MSQWITGYFTFANQTVVKKMNGLILQNIFKSNTVRFGCEAGDVQRKSHIPDCPRHRPFYIYYAFITKESNFLHPGSNIHGCLRDTDGSNQTSVTSRPEAAEAPLGTPRWPSPGEPPAVQKKQKRYKKNKKHNFRSVHFEQDMYFQQ